MHKALRSSLIQAAEQRLASRSDPTHDLQHALRVMENAAKIAQIEGGDEDVLVAASLFHDIVIYPKHGSRAAQAPDASADLASEILSQIPDFPQQKVSLVAAAIRACSFSKGAVAQSAEAKILQDADGLEAVGAIAIMRTFGYSGTIGRPFYHPQDPFALQREADSSRWALDLFFNRLLLIGDRLHTDAAKAMAQPRIKFLQLFLDELKLELDRGEE